MRSVNPIKKSFCTTREAADLLGVSLRTAQLWVESGLLKAWKTEGGHRRIERDSVEHLLADPSVAVRHGAAVSQVDEQANRPLSVLVAEDEATLRLIYETNITRWPMAPLVTVARDGYEALVRIGHARPDLLIADLQMPGMDGFRMIRTIRAMPELADMSIIVVTGLDEEDIIANGGLPDGIPIFSKPVPFNRLREVAVEVAAKLGRDLNPSQAA